MSSVLEYLDKNPQEAQRLVGLKYEQLKNLIAKTEELHREKQLKIESKKTRLIKKGGGRKAKLSIAEQILLTLVYLRHLPTFQMLGIQFGISETTANDIFNYWFPNLRELLPASMLEQVKKNESDYEIVKEILTEFELIVDSCEQPRERPSDYEEQKKYYSGKKKNHTFKNQLIVMPLGKDIVDVKVGEVGKGSDINLWKERQKEFAPQQKFQGDKAYVGDEAIKTPQKKPPKKQLNLAEKEKNKELAKKRIFVEHLIRIVKIWRIAQERFRLNTRKYEQIVLTICGLVRLRIKSLILSG
jgi:hypothetical protein